MSDNGIEASLEEPRLIVEDGLAARIAAIAEPIGLNLGYRLVRVRVSGQNGTTLQIMLERPDGSFRIEDCEAFSRSFAPVLDVEDPIASAYNLEVSSPGIDRPLVRKSDFARWTDQDAKIEFTQMIEGRKRVRGFITAAEDNDILVSIADLETPLRVPYTALAEARLVMTDKLLAEAKKRASDALKETGVVTDGAEIDADAHDDLDLQEDSSDNDNRRNRNGR